MASRVPDLVLGPLLRYAGTKSATFWVETSESCEVEVLGERQQTFAVEGHHYALILVEDLTPASVIEYDVLLDGRVVWPLPTTAGHVRRSTRVGASLRSGSSSALAASVILSPRPTSFRRAASCCSSIATRLSTTPRSTCCSKPRRSSVC
jgi:hypothetical protein